MNIMTHLLNLLLLVFCLLPLNNFGQSIETRKTIIVIDAGHGGIDSGSIGINGIQEKDMVLKVAYQIVNLNKNLLANTYEIYLTRYHDSLISLKDRATLPRKLNADLFVSLHCNHSGNSTAEGVEIYVPKKGNYIRESIQMAFQVLKGLRRNIGYKSRGVKFNNFQVLRETVDYCPTVLIELGFLSNIDEAQHLTEEENIIAIALSILSGLMIKK